METETYYRLALNYLEGCGNSTIKEMLKYSGTAFNLFENQDLWRSKIQKKPLQRMSVRLSDKIRRAVEHELKIISKNNIGICHYLDTGYPARLKRCQDSPLQYYYKGNNEFNFGRVLAVVGTRNASAHGAKSVVKILNELKDSNIVTVSGLAYGIDTVVHEESVNLGIRTIAVLGCGLKTIYPATNTELASKIVDSGGTVVSEFSYETVPDRVNFPKRNRIIAGMSDAVLVAESGLKGGSIITAHIANSYNRDVFAIPGSIFDDSYAGCNNLIRKNIAALVTSGGDILEMMNWDAKIREYQTELFVELSDGERLIVDYLRAAPRSIDEISEHCAEFTPSKIAGLLLGLELKGALEALPGKMYKAATGNITAQS